MNTIVDITITKPAGVITLKDILDAEQALIDQNLVNAELERLIANYETYGDFEPVKPELSPDAVIPVDLLKAS